MAWRRRSWRCRHSRRCRCPRSGPAPSPDADGLLSFPRAAVEVVVLGASTASRCDRAFPRLDAAATRLLPLTHGVVSGVGRKTPMGLVAGALGLRPHPAFEARCRGRRGESDEDIPNDSSTSTSARARVQAPSSVGPITRARARELNYILILKNEGTEHGSAGFKEGRPSLMAQPQRAVFLPATQPSTQGITGAVTPSHSL
jgi:hypothetical protein